MTSRPEVASKPGPPEMRQGRLELRALKGSNQLLPDRRRIGCAGRDTFGVGCTPPVDDDWFGCANF